MKKFYLNIWDSSIFILYCLEKDSKNEKMLFELLNRGFCYNKQNRGKWFSIEFFEEPNMETGTTIDFNYETLENLFYNIKEYKFIGSVDTNGYKEDGKPYIIAPVFVITSEIS